ncbi:hypothetical protein PtB15_1B250 [Puccinia triticina]|nr:hypothetical protein PtB15_1B250 [Puccinia triticina]
MYISIPIPFDHQSPPTDPFPKPYLDPSLFDSPSGLSPNISDLRLQSDCSPLLLLNTISTSGTRSQLPRLDPAPASGKPKQARRTKAQMIAHQAQLAQAKAEEARIKTHGVANRYKGKGGKKNAPRSWICPTCIPDNWLGC